MGNASGNVEDIGDRVPKDAGNDAASASSGLTVVEPSPLNTGKGG